MLGQVQTVARNNGRPDFVSRAMQAVVMPPARVMQWGLGVADDFWVGVRDSHSLRLENERLRALADSAKRYQENIDRLTARLESMSREVGYVPPPPRTKVFARVVGLFRFQNRATLDRGSESGIKPQMPVVAANGLFGVVDTVSKGSCQVLLITSPSIRVAAKVLSAKEVPAIARGETSVRLALDMLESDEIHTGDFVVTSGYSTTTPAGIPIGTVVEARDDPRFGTKRVFVLPNVQIGEVHEVFVLK
ncbi:MAG TPA: rod shape-determining protein MreC [Fimbriimonadaceae bacterium]|nr:rod shape-determining protein MreC [Fimbriimonadaceae bacterium]